MLGDYQPSFFIAISFFWPHKIMNQNEILDFELVPGVLLILENGKTNKVVTEFKIERKSGNDAKSVTKSWLRNMC